MTDASTVSGLFAPSTYWIWHPDLSGNEIDVRVHFRRVFHLEGVDITRHPELKIAADSRYTLYLNETVLGSGPPRHWPAHRPVEIYDIGGILRNGKNTIEVLVHSIGTSTSSYIPGRAGLLLELSGISTNGDKARTDEIESVITGGTIGTDAAWKCRQALEYESGPPRINVSQPFVERYDQRRTEDSVWTSAAILGPAQPGIVLGPMGAPKRSVESIPKEPQFEPMRAYPWRTVSREDWHIHEVTSLVRGGTEPLMLSIDYRQAFFPGDITTEDRLQVGAIAIGLKSDVAQHARILRKNRRWPYEPERLWVNGTEYVIGKEDACCTVSLQAGSNFVLCDVSGAYQRFWLDLVLVPELSNVALGTLAPVHDTAIVAVGPFDSAAIGNIVCSDGFSVEFEHEDYLAVQSCTQANALTQYVQWLRPVSPAHICVDNAKLHLEYGNFLRHSHVSWNGSALVVHLYDVVTIDFGDEVSGYIELDLDIPWGCRVDGVCYEYHRDNAPELPDDLNNWFRYVSDGRRNVFKSTLRRGFRYLTLTFYPANELIQPKDAESHMELRVHAVRCHERLFPTPDIANFECSDRRLTEIFAMSRRTVALCMEDTYVDCPGFEQALWIGDTRNTALLSYVLFGAYGVARRSLLVAAHSLQRSELPESHGPSGVPLILTAWALLWMIAVREYVLHSGDTTIIPEIAPWLAETADGIHHHINHDGLLQISAWNMLDWAAMDTPYHGVVTHQNMLAVWALREAATLLDEHPGHAPRSTVERMLQDASTISEAANANLWDPLRHAYRDSIHADNTRSSVFSVQTNVIALLAGVVPEDHREELLSLINNPPEDMVPIGSPFMSFFLYRLLLDQGEANAHEIISEIQSRWGEMIDEGSTTCWETFRGFYTERLTRSYCHAWSAAPAWYLPEIVLGLKRADHAWRRVEINLKDVVTSTDITWARGSIITPHGRVSVSWHHLPDGTTEVSSSAPDGVVIDIV